MASDQLDEIYINANLCTVCYKEVQQHSQPRSCRHVICEKCNADFRKSNPGRNCKFCVGRNASTGSADDSYLIPVRPPIPPKRRLSVPSSVALYCASCRKKVPTTAYCEDCKGDICRPCYEQHESLSALRNHKVDLKTPGPDSPTSPPIYCRQHPGKYVNSVCETCGGVRVCRECVQEAHVSHVIQDSTVMPLERPTVTLTPGLPSVPQDTYEDLVRHLENLQLNVEERTETLSSSMAEAETKIQMDASSCVQSVVQEAEKTKRDIDQQVSEYTEKISRRKDKLLNLIRRRQNFIQQKSQMINFELKKTHQDAQKLLTTFNRRSLDGDGYTQMMQCQDLFTKRQQMREKIDSLQKSFNDLTFEYLVSEDERSTLGKITPLRKWSRITDSCVQRIKQDIDYVPSAMMSAPNDTILFTSYKGSTKAALDLVNINGNAIHTRKLQDNGQAAVPTPAFGAMIDSNFAVMGWETTIFTLKLSTLDPVTSIGVKNLLVPSARIRCLVSNQNLKRVAIGNDKNRIINIFNFDLKPTSTVTIKEEGPPPSSLAFQGKCILFTDGDKTALAVDRNGNTVAQFLPPELSSLKPMAIDASRGLVYVLWVNSSSAVVQCYSMQNPTMLGNPIGEPLNELPEDTKFIAVITTADGDDRLVTGTPDGRIVVYCVQEI